MALLPVKGLRISPTLNKTLTRTETLAYGKDK